VAHIKTFHLIKINGNTGTQQQKKNDCKMTAPIYKVWYAPYINIYTHIHIYTGANSAM